ncbi:MAG: recombinase family protein [Lachnospiraceae bacterium]|nr:recombinase family protein [Lachnospiraceae bacterium]
MNGDKIKCYIYTRVSTALQVDGYSLDAQRETMRKYADFQNMEIVREYSDEGHSGKNIRGRQEFVRMLNDIEDGKDEVSFVLVFKLLRFGRNAADVLSSLQLMQDYGVNLICVEDNIDSSKEAGKLLISIIAAVAEMERENIRVQTMAGRMQKAREGKWNGGFAPYGYALESGELVIAEDEADIIRMIFDRYINTDDGINGVANYLNNHGYTKKLRQNGTIPGFSTSFVKKIIDNPIYMGKIAYGRRRTEKKNGTRNETHVVEQSEYPIYEGIHEAIISEEEWNLAQEKRSKNNYRREKVNDPDHAHILSGILRCPCCGKGMYGNVAKAHSKDNKTRYYYYCKNTVNATGHKCTFRTNIEQSQIDGMLERLISAMTREGKFKEAIQSKIGTTVDTSDMEKELSVLSARLHQAEAIKTRIEQQMDSLDVNTAHYEKKIADLQRRLDSQYDTIDETEHAIEEVKTQIFDLKKSSISADSIYEFLLHFDEIYRECTDAERKKFMQSFVDRIELYPERRKDGNWIKNILFNFSIPVVREDEELARIGGISLGNSTLSNVDLPLEKFPTHETVVLLNRILCH